MPWACVEQGGSVLWLFARHRKICGLRFVDFTLGTNTEGLSRIPLWGQHVLWCSFVFSLSQPFRTSWTFLFACRVAEGSCNLVRGEIRTKNPKHLEIGIALQLFIQVKVLESTQKEKKKKEKRWQGKHYTIHQLRNEDFKLVPPWRFIVPTDKYMQVVCWC